MLDDKAVLRHKNRELGVVYNLAKEELNRTKDKLAQYEAERDKCNAILSVVDRSWKLLNSDLTQLCEQSGITLPNKKEEDNSNNQKMDEEENDNNTTTQLALKKSASILKILMESDKFTASNPNLISDEDEDEEDDGDEQQMVDSKKLSNILKQRAKFSNELLAGILNTKNIQITSSSPETKAINQAQRNLEAKTKLLKHKLEIAKQSKQEVLTQLEESQSEISRLMRKIKRNQDEQNEQASTTPVPEASKKSSVSTTTATTMTKDSTSSSTSMNNSNNNNQNHPTNNNNNNNVVGNQVHHSNDGELGELQQIAEDRLKEIDRMKQKLDELLTKEASLSDNPKLSELKLVKEQERLKQEYDRAHREKARAQQVSLICLEKLKLTEEKLDELEAASNALFQESLDELKSENQRLKETITEFESKQRKNEKDMELENNRLLRSADFHELLKQIEQEKDSLKEQNKALSSNGGSSSSDEALIQEIVDTNNHLNTTREKVYELEKLIEDRDNQIYEIQTEKGNLESELREIREEKNAFALKADRSQSVLQEHDTYNARLDQKLKMETEKAEKAEALAQQSVESALKAVVDRDSYKRELDVLREKSKLVDTLEQELKTTKISNEDLKYDLSRSHEEVGRFKRRLDRAKGALEEASEKDREGSSDLEERRLEAMQTALRCPVYHNMWKDCVIKTCAHMFSRKALEDNLAQRNRKCPSCKNNYSKDDILNIYLYQKNYLF